MKTDTPQTIYLKDYTAPAYLVDTVDLDINIETGTTTVTATLAMRRNPELAAQRLAGVRVPDKFEALPAVFFARVRDGYQQRCSADPGRFARIDAAATREAVWAAVLQALRTHGCLP